jgi:tRNA(adenine34) deaminase
MAIGEQSSPESYMAEALSEARSAAALGEVPIGAVVVVDGEVVSRAHNMVETKLDATLHAEIIAIRRASENLGSWRLKGAALYVTLEPCPMCLGAMILSRIDKLYFGAHDPRLGSVGSCFDLSDYPGWPHAIEVYSGLLADESSQLLQSFFEGLRKEK